MDVKFQLCQSLMHDTNCPAQFPATGCCNKPIMHVADIPYFHLHALRHAGASIMGNNQVSIGAIQRILGHENRTTTEIYLHSLGNAEIEAVKTLERAREVSHTEQKSA